MNTRLQWAIIAAVLIAAVALILWVRTWPPVPAVGR